MICFLLFPVCLTPLDAGAKITVNVDGVTGELEKNVLARLGIYLQKDKENLPDRTVERYHSQAAEDIRSALTPFGYYDVKIVDPVLTRKDKGWVAEYHIVLGEPVKVDSVSVNVSGSGGEFVPLLKAAGEFALKKGDVLNQDVYEKEKKRLLGIALNNGFLDAKFEKRELRVDREKKICTILLELNTGQRYSFGETTSGQDVLVDSLLERYLPYKAGDPYNPKKLFELQSILYRTDYFSKVVVRGRPDDSEDLSIPIEVDLTPPRYRNKYTIGLGGATDTGARGKLDWSNRLFNRYGHKLSGSLQFAELESIVNFSYEIPRADPRYDSQAHTFSYNEKTWEDTTTKLLTAGISRAHVGPVYNYSAGLELREELYDVGDTSGDSQLLVPSLNGGMVLADDILHTKNGLQASVGLQGGVNGLISDVDFLEVTLSGKAILSPFDGWRILGRGSLGAILVSSIDKLPPSLRFYTGGDNSIRGYAYKSIGTTDSSGAVIGGRYLVVGSIELERSITEEWAVAGFFDSGTATDDLSLNFSQGTGGGLRYQLPFGQIRLDVACAITEPNNPIRFHFTLGGSF